MAIRSFNRPNFFTSGREKTFTFWNSRHAETSCITPVNAGDNGTFSTEKFLKSNLSRQQLIATCAVWADQHLAVASLQEVGPFDRDEHI